MYHVCLDLSNKLFYASFTGRIEKGKVAIVLATYADAGSNDRPTKRYQTPNDVQRRRPPSSTCPEKLVTGAFHVSCGIQIRLFQHNKNTDMPFLLTRDFEFHQIDSADIKVTSSRICGCRRAGSTTGGEKGEKGETRKGGTRRVWACGVLDVCRDDRQTREAMCGLRSGDSA